MDGETRFMLSNLVSDKRSTGEAKEVGGQAYIPFKSNATWKCRGSRLWRKMFAYFQLNQEEFMAHYHKRSNAETTFHMIKAKLGDKVKSKNPTARRNELLCKVIAHDIGVLIHEMYELGIPARLLLKKCAACSRSRMKGRLC